MKRYFYEVLQNGKFTASSLLASCASEAIERLAPQMKSGALLFLQQSSGEILFEKEEK